MGIHKYTVLKCLLGVSRQCCSQHATAFNNIIIFSSCLLVILHKANNFFMKLNDISHEIYFICDKNFVGVENNFLFDPNQFDPT